VPINALTAYAHVADVERSVAFYRHLGLEVQSRYESAGTLVWALVTGPGPGDARGEAGARLMLALASGPIDAGSQAVLFYCWTSDVVGLHAELVAAGVAVDAITHPPHMRAGEFRMEDPDGYVVLVGQPVTVA
jgi:catechol 2,3-dioxygenase-like lactoylglutathione lyase family enzyme